MLDPDFTCCCIPTINAGIYFILFEQLLVGIVAGVCAIATSTVIGALALPSFTGWIFAILCFVVGAVQVLGLVGVVQERAKLFRMYSAINLGAVLAAFACGAVLTLVAGLKHSDSSTQCQQKYYGNSTSGTSSGSSTNISLAGSADEICDIFVIVDASLMGGLWLLLAIVQSYFLFVIRLYAREQKSDHSRYFSMYSTKGGFPDEDIPLSHPASAAWDARPSTDDLGDGAYAGAALPHTGYRDAEGGFEPPPGKEGYGREDGVYDASPSSAYLPVVPQQQQQQQQQGHYSGPSQDYAPGQPFPRYEQGYNDVPQEQQLGYVHPHQPAYEHQEYPHQPAYGHQERI